MCDIFIHPSAEVSENAEIGTETKIWNQAQIREGAKIGNNCTIGKGVYIDTGVCIGNRTKIQNGVSIYQGVTLDDDVLVGPHAAFTNDLFPRAFNKDWKILPTRIKRGASIGANATIICGVTIGEYGMVAAGAVVTSDVPPHCLVIGNPARISARVCRCGCKLQREEVRDDIEVLHCPHCGTTIRMEMSISAMEREPPQWPDPAIYTILRTSCRSCFASC